ncbi:hypothetical protein DFH09DRAFT_1320919 [Mycena vulgaris]|nr:hypothetical protein DFH09DRAFT_1320919 [Mycena vulgaris]
MPSARKRNFSPLLQLFRQFFIGLAIIFSYTPTTLVSHVFTAARLVAVESNSTLHAVTLAFSLIISELSILFFCTVFLGRPKWVPNSLRLHPSVPVRYHRTHISHLRMDRAAKYGLFPPKAVPDTLACSSWFDWEDLGCLLSHGFTHNAATVTDTATNTPDTEDIDPDPNMSENVSDSMPELQVVEDEDEEEDDDYGLAESESDDEIITAEDVPSSPTPSPFRFNRPIFVIDPPHPRRCLNYLRSYGGGTDSPAPIDVTTTDDEDSFNSDGGSAHYNPTDWIGAGKTWSNSLPSAVKRARNTARCVPHNARLAVIPDDKMPVSDMLFEALPNPSTDTRPASFSTEPANIVESTTHHWCYTLFTTIPFLPTLRGSFNDAWISGSKSICFPHLPGKFYPLWTENFLSEIKSFVSKRSRWQSATEWLKGLQLPQDEPHTSLLNRAWRVLGRLPWDGVVPGLSCAVHLTMPDLASFLGTDWLNDEMINAGADWILRRLEPWSRVRIINCLFIQSLANARTAAGGGSYNPAQFSPIDKAILAGIVDNLYFPLHVSGNHWTLLKIDLVAKTISYTDSLGALGRSPPAEELALVRWWLKSLLPDSPSFSLVPPDFPYPRQTDGHSCGIIVLSTLAMILLDYDAWSPDHAECHRLQWFLNLSETLASPGETVCLSPF